MNPTTTLFPTPPSPPPLRRLRAVLAALHAAPHLTVGGAATGRLSAMSRVSSLHVARPSARHIGAPITGTASGRTRPSPVGRRKIDRNRPRRAGCHGPRGIESGFKGLFAYRGP